MLWIACSMDALMHLLGEVCLPHQLRCLPLATWTRRLRCTLSPRSRLRHGSCDTGVLSVRQRQEQQEQKQRGKSRSNALWAVMMLEVDDRKTEIRAFFFLSPTSLLPSCFSNGGLMGNSSSSWYLRMSFTLGSGGLALLR